MGVFHSTFSAWTNEREDGVRVVHDLNIKEADLAVTDFLDLVSDGTITNVSTRNAPDSIYHEEDGCWGVWQGHNFLGRDSTSIGPYGTSDFWEEGGEEDWYDENSNYHEATHLAVSNAPEADYTVFIDRERSVEQGDPEDKYYVRFSTNMGN